MVDNSFDCYLPGVLKLDDKPHSAASFLSLHCLSKDSVKANNNSSDFKPYMMKKIPNET